MESLANFKERVCSVAFEEIEFKSRAGFEMLVSESYRYIVNNTTFVDVYFAKEEEKYYILIYKINGRQRELIAKEDCDLVEYQTVFEAIDKALT